MINTKHIELVVEEVMDIVHKVITVELKKQGYVSDDIDMINT